MTGIGAETYDGWAEERRGAQLLGQRKRLTGARLLVNVGVRIFPAEQGGCHLFPRKSTVEPKATISSLAELLGPAPTSSSPGCSDPRTVGVPGHLQFSFYHPWRAAAAP